MAFVNEYISQDDIKKYKFDEMLFKANPELKGVLPSYYTPIWTIDRERNIYMQSTGSYDQAREDDPWVRFKLVIHDKSVFNFKLWYGAGKSVKTTDDPYIIVWDFKSMDVVSNSYDIPQNEITQLLKEALTVYGYLGAGVQIKNTVVRFNF